MASENIKAGIEIQAGVKGLDSVARLSKAIDEAGIDTAELTKRGGELAQSLRTLEQQQNLIGQFKKLKIESQGVGAELAAAQAKTAALAQEMNKSPSKKLEREFKAATTETRALKTRQQELAAETHKIRGALDDAGVSTRNLAAEERKLASESQRVKGEIGQLTAEAQKLKRQADAKMTLGLHVDGQSRNELQRLNAAYHELKNNGNLTNQELARATTAYTQKVRELGREMDTVPGKQTAIAQSVKSMSTSMLGLAGVGGGLYAVKQGLAEVITTSKEFEAIGSRMEYAFGGMQGAGEQMDWVRGVAQELGLELKSAANGYAQLASATKNIGMSTEHTQQVFKGVAAAAAKMNLTTDETNGVLLALSQIAGKGKVSMEELRGQLGERLTPAMAIAAKSMGVTTAELEKMVESGIAAEDFLPKFGAAMEEAFGGAESANAALNRLKNQFDELMVKFGESGGINDAFNKVLGEIGNGLAWVEEQIDSLDAALTGGMADAISGTYELVKEAFGEVGNIFTNLLAHINEIGNMFSTVFGGAGDDFDVVKFAIGELNIFIGHLHDGIYGIGVAMDVFAGIGQKAIAKLLEGLALISFGEVSERFKMAAAEMSASADRHFASAEQKALAFESKAASAAEHAAETQSQRLERLEREARTAYEAAATAAIGAAEKTKLAQEKAAQAVGTSQEAITKKAVEESEKVAAEAKKAAQKSETAWNKSAVAIGMASEDIAKIKQPLADAGLAAKETADKVGSIGNAAKKAQSEVSEAFKKIGVDADAAATGISSKANQAFADWAAASAAARDAGIDDTRLIRAGFEQMMGKLESRAEFEAFKRQLQESGDVAKLTKEQLERLNKSAKDGATAAKTAYEQMGEALKEASNKADFARIAAEAQAAFEAGTISAAEYDQMMAQVKQATDEAAAKAAEMGSKAVDAHKKATIEASNYEASVKRSAAATADATKANQSASGAASEGTRTITQLHQANTKLYGVTKLTKEEFIAYSKAMRGAVHDGMDWFQAQRILASRKQEFIKPIVEGRQAIEELNQAISSGTLSAQQITRAALIAGEAVGKLDQATLKTLNASIDAAKAKLVELKDEAVGVRQSLEAELAALNGNDEMGYQLEHQKKIADLQAKAAQASARQQHEAVAEYNRAMSLQNQIYTKQKAQREKERAEAAADAKKAAQAPAPSRSSNSNSGNPLPDVDLSRLNFGGDVGKFNDTLAQMLAERDQKVVNAAGKAVIDQLTDAVARQK